MIHRGLAGTLRNPVASFFAILPPYFQKALSKLELEDQILLFLIGLFSVLSFTVATVFLLADFHTADLLLLAFGFIFLFCFIALLIDIRVKPVVIGIFLLSQLIRPIMAWQSSGGTPGLVKIVFIINIIAILILLKGKLRLLVFSIFSVTLCLLIFNDLRNYRDGNWKPDMDLLIEVNSMPFLALFFAIGAAIYIVMINFERERNRADDLLFNILPSGIARRLKRKENVEPREIESVSILFTDFVGFTKIAEGLGPGELVKTLNVFFSAFDEICGKYQLEKIKTIGDAYMCVGGLVVHDPRHADHCVKAALEMRAFVERFNREHSGNEEWKIRIGIHSGPVIAGVIGLKKFTYDVWGDTVNIASRMESSGLAGKVNISRDTKDLLQEDFACVERGLIKAKNKGKINMFLVEKKNAD